MKTTFRRLGAAARALALMVGFIVASQVAHAACTGPSGNAGDMIYASNYNSMAFCNGTTWTSMAGGVSVTVNTSGGGATPAGSSSDVQFNSSGALAADTGNFTYASGLLKAPNISTTAITASGQGTFNTLLVSGGATVSGNASLTTVSTSLIQIGGSLASCTAGLIGGVRYNSTSNTLQVCLGSAWTSLSSDTTAAGSAQGDRITSGTLSIIANTGSAFASLTTNGMTWGYLSSNASYIPTLQTQWENNGTISTTLMQVGTNSATCNSGMYGGIRWNATSDTIQICNSGGWTSVASSSVPNTTISQGQNNYAAIFSGPNTLVTDSALYVDRTNHRLSVGGTAPVTDVDVSGTKGSIWVRQGVGGSLGATAGVGLKLEYNSNSGAIQSYDYGAGIGKNLALNANGGNVGVGLISPTATLQVAGSFIVSNSASPSSPSLYIGTNGEVSIGSTTNAWTNSGSGLYVTRYANHFGIVIAGTPNYQADLVLMTTQNAPDQHGVQLFNSADQFGIRTVTDAGLPGRSLFIANLTTGSVGISNTNPIAKLDVTGTVSASDAIQVGSSSLSCASSINGAIRYNATSGTIQVCAPNNVWTSLASGTTAGGGSPSGSTGDIQFNTAGSFDADTGKLYWDKTNDELGVGTSVPSATLHVTGTGTPYAMFGPSGTGAIELRKDDSASGFFIRNDGVNPVISTKVGNLYFGYGGRSGMALNFYTSNTFAGTWDPYGRLGIGTAAPAYTLDVSGQMRVRYPSATQLVVDTTAASQQAAIGFYSNGAGKWQIGKNNGEQFFVWDGVGVRNAINIYSNGSMGLMPDSGNVGIGTYTPGSRFDVSSTSMRLSTTGGSNTPYMEWYKDGGRQAYIGWGAPGAGFNITTEANNPLYINASQTTVSGQLYAAKNIFLNNATNNVVFYGSTGVAVPGANSNGEKIQLYGTAGTVGASDYAIGIESGTMWFNGSAYKWYAGAVQKMLLDASGNLTATAFLYSSDKRLKSDITHLTGGLAKLDSINPVSFRFTADPSKTIHLGLIAQDVQKVYPDAVHKDEKGYLKLDYPALIGPVFDVLKELKGIVVADHGDLDQAKIEISQLKADNDNLHSANADLMKEVQALKADNDNTRARLDAIERGQSTRGR